MTNIPLTGTNGPIGKYGHIVLFGLGFWVLRGAARLFYLLSWASIILGFFLMRFDNLGPSTDAPAPDNFWDSWHPTIWSYGLWAFGIWCIIMMFATVRQQREEYYSQQALEELEADIDTVSGVHPVQRGPVAPAAPRSTHVEETTTESGLIIPSYTKRRVLRGGETLSGTPIKDHRSVDPRTL